MILTDIGHIDLATSMQSNIFWLAWGKVPVGQEWTSPPPADITSTTLIQEVGRTKELVKDYVVKDVNGGINIGNYNWSVSATPTKYLYVKFSFEETNNDTDDIYQLGIFTNTVPVAGKENETYLLPADIQDMGNLIFLENIEVIHRNNVTKEIFEYIITF